MKTNEEIINFLEKEIQTLKRMILNVANDDDELLNEKVYMSSSLICSYGEQIKLLEGIKNFMKDGE